MPPPRPSFPHVRVLENVCWQCSHRLDRLSARGAAAAVVPRHYFSKTALPRATVAATIAHAAPSLSSQQQQQQQQQQRFRAGYFLSNSLLGRIHSSRDGAAAAAAAAAEESPSSAAATAIAGAGTGSEDSSNGSAHTPNSHLPHRRRQAERRLARTVEEGGGGGGGAAGAATQDTLHNDDLSNTTNMRATTATAPVSSSSDASPKTTAAATQPEQQQGLDMPPDASAILAGVAARQPASSARRYFSALLSLAKPRLTVLVVLSAMSSYALYPVPAFLTPMVDAPSLSPLTLLYLTSGTTLCAAAANALNMLYEPRTDALMSRTRSRPLVRGLVSPAAALLFATACAVAGVAALYLGISPTVSFLGLANIVLYAGVYTPLKRVSAANTWVGAVVGGIPPLMGWAAAAGETATADAEDGGTWRALLFAPDGSSAGGWLLAGLLFAWQFPHFMALSWGVRAEYKAAGLRMLCWTNPARNARVALRYSLAFLPLSAALCAVGVTDWSFAVTSFPVNAWLIREAVRFWRFEGHKGSARGLFWASVWHLPVIMVLALLSKKGMWGRVWRSIVGNPEDEDDDDDDDWEEEDEEGDDEYEEDGGVVDGPTR